MFSDIQGIEYCVNQMVFFVLLFLSYFIGQKIAYNIVESKEKNKRQFYSFAFLFPSIFLITFFVSDTLYLAIIKNYNIPSLLLSVIYWISITFLTAVVSMTVLIFMKRTNQKENVLKKRKAREIGDGDR